MRAYLIALAAMVVLMPAAQAFTMDASTIIQPNSSASGHYVLNSSITLSSLEVNSTYAVLEFSVNTVCSNVTLDNGTVLCSGSTTCLLPQETSIIDLNCTSAGSVLADFTSPTPGNATEYDGKQAITINVSSDSSMTGCTLTWRGTDYVMTKISTWCTYNITDSMEAFEQWLVYSVTVAGGSGNSTSDRYVWFWRTSSSSGSGDSTDDSGDQVPSGDDSDDETRPEGYCGNGYCDVNESTGNCVQDCSDFSADPASVTRYLKPEWIEEQVRVSAFSDINMTAEISCVSDESCEWAAFLQDTRRSRLDFPMEDNENVTVYVVVIPPDGYNMSSHYFEIRLTSGNQTSVIPFNLIVKYEPGMFESIFIWLSDGIGSVYYEFPNRAMPPITGWALLTAGVLIAAFAGSAWMLRRNQRKGLYGAKPSQPNA